MNNCISTYVLMYVGSMYVYYVWRCSLRPYIHIDNRDILLFYQDCDRIVFCYKYSCPSPNPGSYFEDIYK